MHGCLYAALMSALRRHCDSLYTCWDAVSGQGRARDEVYVRPVQCGGCRVNSVGLVSGSGTKHVHAQQTSTRTAKAHLDWDVYAGRGEGGIGAASVIACRWSPVATSRGRARRWRR